MSQPRRRWSEHQVERFIGNLLRFGVLFATIVVVVGGILYLIHYGTSPANYQFFRGEPPEFNSLEGVRTAVLSGRRRGIIQFGLLLLIATPIARVIFSLFAFVRQKDLTYIIVTSIVLIELIYSLMGKNS
ncbi:MAG: DUF1634 domain-containing protein [Nostoc sp.]|uniref:DUF1634 domain-containing protein n=1 Tax=Nostoc sp. TaxID=1180 RepID=UPI002FF84DF4